MSLLLSGAVVPQAAGAEPGPVELTAEQDHRRLLDLLGISSLRPGADGRDPHSATAANYDESKANPYPKLPELLVLKSGDPVTTAKAWWEKRRPEIVEEFDREVYGRVPPKTPGVRWEVAGTAADTKGGIPVLTKKLVGRVDNSGYPAVTVVVELSVTTPADATGPVPVVLEVGFNFVGRRSTGPPAVEAGPSWQEQVLARGWGYAVFFPTSVQADNGVGLTRGIIGLVNKGRPRALDDWGALRAWAWGASRALDYLETDAAVDAKQVAIEGHSRYGKAALVAMATDPRFAAAFISSSGAGGAKLHRRDWGERVENVAGPGQYHWMAGNYLKYAGPLTPDDLPVDAHQLVALCAPRPVFISSGETGDGWVDAKGMFLAAVGAGPVYRLLGQRDLGTTEYPPVETALIDGEIAFRQHAGGHTPGPNWPTFLTFAARYLKTAPAAPPVSKVALTIDDLPTHGALPPGKTRADIASSLLGALHKRGAPAVYGFVNARPLEGDGAAEVLRLWRASGHPLANHAYSHMDLHANSAEAFEQDVVANEPALRTFMEGADWHWFRYPFLHEGETLEKRRRVAAFLKERGYKTAQVTLDFNDYAYNDPYARCLAKKDTAAIEWMQESYLRRASESLTVGRATARRVYDRDVSHVLLLHVGGFEMLMLPKLLDLLAERGFELVTLEEAHADPVFAAPPAGPFAGGVSFLEQMRETKGLPSIERTEDPFQRLEALCR